MKHHLRATAHLYLLAALVCALLSIVFGCSANGVSRLGGAGAGAAVGAAVGGPLGAGVGAIAGDAGANLVVPPEPCVQTRIDNHDGGIVNAVRVPDQPWYAPWVTRAEWAAALLALLVAIPRTRPHVLGFLYSALHAHPGAALAKAGAALGVVHSATADAMLATARKRRGKVPPAVVVSTTQGPHNA